MKREKNTDIITMNHRYGIFSFFLFSFVFYWTALPAAFAAEDTIHVVAQGETAYSISRTYKITPDELMKYNGIIDATKLQVGQRLRIPRAPSAVSPETGTNATVSAKAGGSQTAAGDTGWTSYKVTKNDTLFSLARNYGTTVQKLKEINGLTSDKIKAGEIIKVPAVSGSGGGTVVSVPDSASKTASVSETSKPVVKPIDSLLRWPVNPKEIAYMTGKVYGVVVLGERAESVKSLTHGTVVSVGPYRGFGKVAMVEVTGGYLYVYGGCESLSVKKGDRIGPGMELGKLGVHAVSGKPQLFFMVYQSNTPIDPAKAPRT